MNAMKLLLGVLTASVLVSCSQPPVPPDRFYRLQVPVPETALAKPPLKGLLEVGRMVAAGLTAGRPIVYSAAGKPLEVNEYHYDFWIEPPATMLHSELVSYLRAAGVARTVVTPEMRLEPDFMLTVGIKQLEQVRGGQPKAVIALEVTVHSRKEERLLMVKTYRVEMGARSASVAAAVEALNAALAEIYAALASDISKI